MHSLPTQLIHGRPQPLKGKFYANAFLHFRPDVWSGYGLTKDNIIFTPDQRIPLRPFAAIGNRLGDVTDHGKLYAESLKRQQEEQQQEKKEEL